MRESPFGLTYDGSNLDLPVRRPDLLPLPRYRLGEPCAGYNGLLRCGPRHTRGGQWHGYCRRLDERSFVHIHAGPDLNDGIRRRCLPHGYDGYFVSLVVVGSLMHHNEWL